MVHRKYNHVVHAGYGFLFPLQNKPCVQCLVDNSLPVLNCVPQWTTYCILSISVFYTKKKWSAVQAYKLNKKSVSLNVLTLLEYFINNPANASMLLRSHHSPVVRLNYLISGDECTKYEFCDASLKTRMWPAERSSELKSSIVHTAAAADTISVWWQLIERLMDYWTQSSDCAFLLDIRLMCVLRYFGAQSIVRHQKLQEQNWCDANTSFVWLSVEKQHAVLINPRAPGGHKVARSLRFVKYLRNLMSCGHETWHSFKWIPR